MRCGKAISRSPLRSGGCDGVAVRADKGLVVLPVAAHSARGGVAAGGEMVRLNGDVVITRPVTGGAPGVEGSTDELEVWPDREYAETARPVTLRDALGVTEAVGLHADFKQDRFELPAQVRGIYAPP